MAELIEQLQSSIDDWRARNEAFAAKACGHGSCDRPRGHDGTHRCRCGKPTDEPHAACEWHTGGEAGPNG